MKTNFFKKSALAVMTLTTASFYFAQEQESEKSIDEIVLVGTVDIAKDRKTPVAVSTIKENAIVEKLGNQEFPEMLNTTPSVYATKAGGGFGDSKINMRGFTSENIAVMVNGMPVNDMENGKVYWSNWSGISDVTSAMQVQRGLGASKLAIASVGGTINIVTRAADKKKQGTLSIGLANDGYHKAVFSYNTGKSEKGWSSSFLLSRTSGAMYADGTNFEAYNYYFALGFQPNKQHDLQFTFTGAPQWHHQRGSTSTIADYIKYSKDDTPNRKYNPDWGYMTGADGVRREYSWRRNHFHKPVTSLNWDWNINEKSKLSTVLYASFGRGGGTGSVGSFFTGNFDANGNPITTQHMGADGQYNFDAIVNANRGLIANTRQSVTDPVTGRTSQITEGMIRRTSVNSHNWYGLLSNYQHKLNENWNFSVGFDGRYYKGYHYQIVSDLLGASGYNDTSDRNNPTRTITNTYSADAPWNFLKPNHDTKDRIAYDNEGEVLWYGGFGQVEYSNEKISAFVQGSVSNQGFQRIDNFIIDGVTTSRYGTPMNKKTGFKNILGYNVKGGLNYNINEKHNVFANAGYYERQPFFNSVYRGNQNFLSPDNTNEKILGLELGYGFRSGAFNANLNLYRTDWKDVFQRFSNRRDSNGQRYFIDINGLREVHQGVEFDASYRINRIFTLNGMFSVGDWHYKGNAKAETFSENTGQAYIPGGATSNEFNLLLDKVKVGNSAQMTAAAGLTVEPFNNFKFDTNWRFVNNLYSNLDVFTFSNATTAEKGALQLPSYHLFDLGLSYKLDIGNKQSFTLRGNVYNLLDTTYIAESETNIHATDRVSSSSTQTYEQAGRLYKGVATANYEPSYLRHEFC